MKTLSIMGRLGHSPRVKDLDSGDTIVTLQVAVNDRVKAGTEWKDEATWIDVVVFGKRGKYLAERLQTGDTIVASGEMVIRHYQGRDQRDKTRIELRASKCDPCGPRRDGGQGPGGQPQQQQRSPPQRGPEARARAGGSSYDRYGGQADEPHPDDDLPF